MGMYLKFFRLLLLLGGIFLVGCGGSNTKGSSSTTFNDDERKSRPRFTSPNKINFKENSTKSVIITAEDASDVDFEINGEDRRFFRIYQDETKSSATLDFISSPNYEVKNQYILTIIADDGFNHRVTQHLVIHIIDVDETVLDNTPPKFATIKKTFTIDENKISIGKVFAVDTNRINYYISGGEDASSFKIDSSTGVLEFNQAPNYESKSHYEVDITAEDSKKNKSLQRIDVTIRDVDETTKDITAPTLNLPKTLKVYENETYVIRIEATDINTIVYSINGKDAHLFTINSITGVLDFKVAPDYEKRTTYYLNIIAKDSKGNTTQVSNVKILILNITEELNDTTAPTFTSLSSENVNENQLSAIRLRATDNNSITYNISGVDANYFNINSATGVVTFKIAPDYETKSSYSFTAIATDIKGNRATKTILIKITDLYEEVVDTVAPIFISKSSISVEENQLSVITLKATDENRITYDISGTDASDFNIDASTGVVTFKVSPDYESKNSYDFVAKAKDSEGNEATQIVNVKILDVNEVSESDYFITTWKTDNRGVTEENQIEIPTEGTGYNYCIDWGDESTESNITGDINHTYSSAGTYTVKIYGDFPRIYFGQNYDYNASTIDNDAEKLVSIEQWGTINWQSMSKAFMGCYNMLGNAVDIPNLSNVTDMSKMFYDTTKFNGDITNWNVSNVINMKGLFYFAHSFNQDISRWDVSNVQIMLLMFSYASSFNQDIGRWDVANVEDMALMFSNATNFNQNLSAWNISKVKDMYEMFHNITLSTTNYSNMLSAWNGQSLQQNVVFGGGNSKYDSTVEGDRQGIIDNFGWTITDGGKESAVPSVVPVAL